MNKSNLWHNCVDAQNNNEIVDVIRNYLDILYHNHPNDIAYIKTELQQCVEIIIDIIDRYNGYIKQEETKLKTLKGMSIEAGMSKMIINISKEKISMFRFLKLYTENKITELSIAPIIPIPPTKIGDNKNTIDTDTNQIKTDIISYIDNKWIVDPNKRVYSREEACEYLQITDRKLTTLLDGKIKPVSTAFKPYTFNIEELERYRKEEM